MLKWRNRLGIRALEFDSSFVIRISSFEFRHSKFRPSSAFEKDSAMKLILMTLLALIIVGCEKTIHEARRSPDQPALASAQP
jgi:hypothetical protein